MQLAFVYFLCADNERILVSSSTASVAFIDSNILLTYKHSTLRFWWNLTYFAWISVSSRCKRRHNQFVGSPLSHSYWNIAELSVRIVNLCLVKANDIRTIFCWHSHWIRIKVRTIASFLLHFPIIICIIVISGWPPDSVAGSKNR